MSVINRVGAYYDRGETLLVFPSEVVAGAWRRRLATDPDRGAVRSDRIVSWDRFKELAVPIKRVERPAGRLTRRAFALALLTENGGAPFLTTLVNPIFADSAGGSAGSLTRMLPQLPALLRHRDEIRPGLAADLAEVMERYRRFLESHNLFEPEWELSRTVDLSHITRCPVIFWPELLEDYREYRALLAGDVEVVTLREDRSGSEGDDVFGDSGDPVRREIRARRVRSAVDEVNLAWDAIESAVRTGVTPVDLAVSVADLDSYRHLITAEANRRGIPVRFAEGGTVASQPGGSFFARLRDVLDGDFGMTAAAGLLMDRSLPWLDEESRRGVVQFGYGTHCYRRARWGEAFALATRVDPDVLPVPVARIPRIREFWETLVDHLVAVRSAETAAALRRALLALLRRYIAGREDPRWRLAGGRAERVYETALTELETICRLEDRGIPIPRPWTFFLDSLAERGYVPRGVDGAVVVYPYRVAAGLPAELHCVIGLSQRATRVRSTPPMGLRQDELRRIGWEGDDRSRAFLEAYGTLFPGVNLTCSDEGPSGAQVPAAELTVDVTAEAPEDQTPWKVEERWWRDPAGSPPGRLYRPQRHGLDRALATTLAPVRVDYQRAPVDGALLPLIKMPERYSPHFIDDYLACPFSVLIRRFLGVSEAEYGFRPDRYRELGSALHDALEVLWGYPGGERRPRVAEAVSVAFSRVGIQLLMPEAGRAAHQRFASAALGSLLEDSQFETDRPATTEATVEGEIGGVPVRGRIDRVAGVAGLTGADVSYDGQPLTIYDYKSSLQTKHGRSGVFGDGGEDPRRSITLQLPLYAMVLEARAPVEVKRLVYVGLRKSEIKRVMDAGASGPGASSAAKAAGDYARMRETLPPFLAEMRAAVERGDLRCDGSSDCSGCRIRSICRSCFVTRRYQDER
jgi:hypothetical protein